MANQFIVVTVWTRFEGRVLVHSYGPFATRALAQSDCRKSLRDFVAEKLAETHPEAFGSLTVHVSKLIDLDAMDREKS